MPALNVLFCLLLLVAGQATATVAYVPRMERVAACSWDRPGHNPFMGDVVAAVDRYTDIPTAVRVRLKQRMQARQYDDFVDIRRDSISGRAAYEPTIRDMHFGLDRVCRQVTRERWSAQMHERGVVYCEQEHCLLVPTVCRNVSRINRLPAMVAGEPAGSTPPSGPRDASSERYAAAEALAPGATRGPEITSSFAEAVAGETLPWWPVGSAEGATPGGDWPGGSGAGPSPWWAAPGGGAGGGSDPGSNPSDSVIVIGGGGVPGDDGGGIGGGGSGIPSGGGGGGFPGGSGGGIPGGSGGGIPGGGGGGGGGVPPVSAIPEPATWASVLLGLGALALVSARRRRPR